MNLKHGLREIWVRSVWMITPRCDDMRELTSRRLDGELGLWDRLRWRLHFVICAFCLRYYRQLRFLGRAAHEAHHHLDQARRPGLRPEARETMKERLREAARAGSGIEN